MVGGPGEHRNKINVQSLLLVSFAGGFHFFFFFHSLFFSSPLRIPPKVVGRLRGARVGKREEKENQGQRAAETFGGL